MDTKRLMLIGGLVVLTFVVFTQAKKMSTPEPVAVAPVQTIVEKVSYKYILAANSDVSFGGRLSPLNMQWKQWPEEAMSPEFISQDIRPDALEAFTAAIARTPIYAGEPITERRIVMAGTKSVMSALIQPGMRAVTTEISTESAAGGFIQPGDHVDIILTSQVQDTTGRNRNSFNVFKANTVFEDVKVLAIDQTFDVGPDGGAAVIGQTATFEMSQGDSEALQVATASGDLALTLRPISSMGDTKGKSHAKTNLMQTEEPPEQTLTVYRAGQPTQVAIQGQQ